jgi:nitrogen fixation/metabolism regulation signal transduction histidine kinase
VLRNVASGVLAVRQDGTITIANPRAEQLLGTTLPAGAPIASLCPAPLVERITAFLATPSGASDEEFDLELHDRQLRARLTRLDATRAVATRTGATRGGDDGAAVLTVDDLTELARAQRVLAWGEMARQVAHEIKNPLTPIRLGMQHLRRAYDDRRGNFDEILERNVVRVLAEIDRLDEIARTFSRYGTAPDQRPPGRPTDVAAVARDTVALERIGEGAVEWEIDGADAPVIAVARDDELREVLLNLLENARHAHARHVRVSIADDERAVTLRVADDGEGIPDELQSRVFEPHFSTRTSGSGLGLAISRRIIDGWGGSITLRSRRGVGTTIVITLRPASLDDPVVA